MVAHAQEKITWHLEALPIHTRRVLKCLSQEQWLRRSKWYLAGGTALALQVGHRSSYDLDFFFPNASFSMAGVTRRFSPQHWTTEIAREGTMYGRLMDAKVSFIAYPFFLPAEPPLWYSNIRLLSARDIAVMKIIAISQRGRKRDFIDLYWYAKNREPIEEVIQRVPRQYPNIAHNYSHILKSLTYFADAESDPMPKLYFSASWAGIKAFFRKEVPAATQRLMDLNV